MDISGNLSLSGAALRGIAPMRADGARANQRAGSAEETLFQKNLRQMKDNLERLRAAASPKRQAAGRVGWLKRRLEIMLTSLQFATPEQAKAMARELKSIAKELASAAKSLDDGRGTVAPGTIRLVAGNIATAGADAADTADASVAQAAQTVQQAEVRADQVVQQAVIAARIVENEAAADAPGEWGIGRTNGISGSSASDADDESLRAQLKEASRLLKQILALLKPRLTDKESKKNTEAAETSLEQVERALSPSDGFYDTLGISVPVARSTGGVDIST
jgi:hypothetical protein